MKKFIKWLLVATIGGIVASVAFLLGKKSK